MRNLRIITAVAALLLATVAPLAGALATEPTLGDIKRTNLLRNDLSVPGREAIQVLVEFEPGVTAVKHSHPGEEIVYVTKGSLEYRLEGKSPVVVRAGEALFIPDGTPHSVKNVGSDRAAELATYVVEKEKPLLTVRE
ncbi:cupin domain-containing protein [Bradyrhizobium centrosematis]|uniref:cupin domain-containing protein n=1 Tax=Bradyrhizobium centrosematis TaxID=1300039 RepID=UPI002167079E|nr:cupin domain-containing protein [Bradyrhizobium centrosematis]MCS3763110.1 quercetin dioxygenase-like cupin family protein [Bradyrhizobium centrosematis]MCS3775777.1 quercetin dioxygenase-like cupin family protein [Bradyrhizobium centrosematis]